MEGIIILTFIPSLIKCLKVNERGSESDGFYLIQLHLKTMSGG